MHQQLLDDLELHIALQVVCKSRKHMVSRKQVWPQGNVRFMTLMGHIPNDSKYIEASFFADIDGFAALRNCSDTKTQDLTIVMLTADDRQNWLLYPCTCMKDNNWSSTTISWLNAGLYCSFYRMVSNQWLYGPLYNFIMYVLVKYLHLKARYQLEFTAEMGTFKASYFHIVGWMAHHGIWVEECLKNFNVSS